MSGSGSMQSSVGNSQIYEANEQRPNPGDAPGPFEAGQPNAHGQYDSKDERSIANKLKQTEKRDHDEAQREKETVIDPLAPALNHGNEPSRGAKIDAELQKDDEEYLKNKGKA